MIFTLFFGDVKAECYYGNLIMHNSQDVVRICSW